MRVIFFLEMFKIKSKFPKSKKKNSKKLFSLQIIASDDVPIKGPY